ncbi:GGDEF domain-containing protein [Alkalibacillus flavidus]
MTGAIPINEFNQKIVQMLNQSNTIVIRTDHKGVILDVTGRLADHIKPSDTIFNYVDSQSLNRMDQILNDQEGNTSDIYLKFNEEPLPYIVEYIIDNQNYWFILTPFPDSYLNSITNIYEATNQLNELYVEKAISEKQLNKALEQLKDKSITDPLTDLHNRQHFYDEIKKLYNAEQVPKRLSFAVIDFNDLKYVNDNFGHLAGDGLLKLFANLIADVQTDRTRVFRIGGDEFILMTTEYELDTLTEIVHNLDHQFREKSDICSLSFGFVTLESEDIRSLIHHKNVDHYISKADRAMYDYKRKIKST